MPKVITLIVILMFGVPVAAQDFANGLAASQAGDWTTALKELKPLAEDGQWNAQHNLGYMYKMEKAFLKIIKRQLSG